MRDLFHEDVTNDFIFDVFVRMFLSPQHTFMILTKRPDKMVKWFNHCSNGGFSTQEIIRGRINQFLGKHPADKVQGFQWPLPNVWLGVSVEDQISADQRIPVLLETPAAVRFVSCEPLLESVNLDIGDCWVCGGCGETPGHPFQVDGMDICYKCGGSGRSDYKIDWVICGGESGPNARPMHPDWARSLRDQCQREGVPFFFKQWGEWLWVHPERNLYQFSSPEHKIANIDGQRFYKVGKRKAGRLLDGIEWNEYPEVM
jgi:protein gp37